MDNEYIRQAVDICEEGGFTPEELATYDKYLDIIRTEKAVIYTSHAEGREEGRAEGREEGMAEGKIEEKLEIARSLKRSGMSISQIVIHTNLSPEEIEQL
jgi:predicted transposase/invertase (TIGR01784 family)